MKLITKIKWLALGGVSVAVPALAETASKETINRVGEKLILAYRYSLGLGGILAAVMLMVGGLIWLTSAGSADKISRAKQIISNSLLGLVLLLSAVAILKFVNPDLVKLYIKSPIAVVDPIKKICCVYTPLNPLLGMPTIEKAVMITESECLANKGDSFPGKIPDPAGKQCIDIRGCCQLSDDEAIDKIYKPDCEGRGGEFFDGDDYTLSDDGKFCKYKYSDTFNDAL
ncbi:hypothetical protein D6821_00415 [Candidatus Parcubacteria bacterium]|nr:MAG: hypothetical protein D6821_00415 [Candidatus Parcubacteria bacterium]